MKYLLYKTTWFLIEEIQFKSYDLLTGKSLPKLSNFAANKNNHNSGIESLINYK